MHPWRRADLHMHTRYSGWRSLRLIDAQDCYVDPQAAYARARLRGMDFVCISDHDTIDGALDLLNRRPELEPRVIVAEEVEARFPDSSEWVHINVFGVDEPMHRDLTRLRSNAVELVRELNRRELFFVLNHPLQSFRSIGAARRHLAELLPLVAGIEVCNSTSPRSHQRILTEMLARLGPRRPVPVGGSDAHTLQRIAAVYTGAAGETKAEYLNNVRLGACRVGGDAPGLPALIRDVYLIIGRYYAQLWGRACPTRGTRRLRNVAVSSALFPAVVLGLPAALTTLQAARQAWIGRYGAWNELAATLAGRVLPASTPGTARLAGEAHRAH